MMSIHVVTGNVLNFGGPTKPSLPLRSPSTRSSSLLLSGFALPLLSPPASLLSFLFSPLLSSPLLFPHLSSPLLFSTPWPPSRRVTVCVTCWVRSPLAQAVSARACALVPGTRARQLPPRRPGWADGLPHCRLRRVCNRSASAALVEGPPQQRHARRPACSHPSAPRRTAFA